ncbi:MAG TPA: hypothetical protein H9746_04140 [Candidatus Butyricicoccus avistercoris]|uniref:Flagellar protein FliT n=1 Tax=Candidatus Butyricicoccus avistercoris TaxID=2838518 RepID=A0A9D1THI5_9FIRM|nr:hypothetical protein [Candidatus Butyricicoccus avistercoris]
MNQDWIKLIVQLKKRYSLLTEIKDLTEQMSDALNRDDEVSFQMLLSMRQEPILYMKESDGVLLSLKSELPEDIIKRWHELENDAEPLSQEETLFKQQMEQNRRLLERIVPFDNRIFNVLKNKKR